MEPSRRRLGDRDTSAHGARPRCGRHGARAVDRARSLITRARAANTRRLRSGCVPRGRRPTVDRLGRRCVRQHDVRELLCDARMRVARPPTFQETDRGPHGRLRLHRGLVQPAPSALVSRLPLTDELRASSRSPGQRRKRSTLLGSGVTQEPVLVDLPLPRRILERRRGDPSRG